MSRDIAKVNITDFSVTERKLHIQKIIILFIVMSVIGYSWEIAAFCLLTDFQYPLGELIKNYHGVLHGPWVPIYGFGGLAMLSLKPAFGKRPLTFFAVCAAVSAVIEYFSSWALEKMFNARWWDYSDYPMQLNGRICLINCLLFGIAGCFAAYLLEPVVSRFLPRISGRFLDIMCFALAVIFIIDFIASMIEPNMGLGVMRLEGQDGI